jgi:hypothetical protein
MWSATVCKIWGFHGGDYDDYHLLGDDNHHEVPQFSVNVWIYLHIFFHIYQLQLFYYSIWQYSF